jgi:hypothetical protein
MKKAPLAALLLLLSLAPRPGLFADAGADAAALLKESGIKGGFVVHVGSGDGQLTAALRASDSYYVHGLDRDPERVKGARESIHGSGAYGPVCVDLWNGAHLPYVEGTVNLLVIGEGESVSAEEIDRVLAPLGVAMTKTSEGWKQHEKPWPASMDEWTHYYYDAKGNAASKDSEVGPPERLQWLGSPRWSRHHDRMASMSAKVSSRGRLFYIMDEGSHRARRLQRHRSVEKADRRVEHEPLAPENRSHLLDAPSRRRRRADFRHHGHHRARLHARRRHG